MVTVDELVPEAQRTTVTCSRFKVRTVPGLELESSSPVKCLARITTFLVIACGLSGSPSHILGLSDLAQSEMRVHTRLTNCKWVFYMVFLFPLPAEPEITRKTCL